MFEELTNEEMEKIDGDGLIKGLLGVVGGFGCCIAGIGCVFIYADKAVLACDQASDACFEWAHSPGCYIW